VVSSGHNLHHHLTVHNLTGSELQIATNGHLTATVVDPQTGEVGGFSGAQAMPLKIFRAAPGRKRADPPPDRHGQLHIPARLHGPSGRLGHPGDAGARPTPPQHTDPAAHDHRLTSRTATLPTRLDRNKSVRSGFRWWRCLRRPLALPACCFIAGPSIDRLLACRDRSRLVVPIYLADADVGQELLTRS
jgi:hypothetical protein